ncbi:MAG: HEAT repeat domain-containing protein [Terriglobia bacterium]
MPRVASHLIELVLFLALVIFLGSLLLIAAAIGRRFKRERGFRFIDSFRERSRSILEGIAAGALEYEAGLEQLQGIVDSGHAETVERILLDYAHQFRYSPSSGRLLENLGMVESWRRQLISVTKPPGASRNPLLLWRGARFYNRARAAQNLGRLGDRQSWPLLVSALDDPHGDVREEALCALAAIREPQSFPALIGRLRASLSPAHAAHSGRVLQTVLARFPLELADQLVPLIEDSNARVRLAAAQVLRGMLTNRSLTDANVTPMNLKLSRLIITQLGGDSDPDVRAAAADLMAFMKDDVSGKDFIRSADDEVWFVRLHAVRALGQRRDLAFHPALAARLTDTRWLVREAAASALSASGAPGVFALMRVFSASDDAYAREQIAEAIETSGLMKKLAESTAAEDAQQEREALQEIVKAGEAGFLEGWLNRQPAPERRAFLASLRGSHDPEVRNWADQMAE